LAEKIKICPKCTQSCKNTSKFASVNCGRCNTAFCWECRTPLSSSTKASHFASIKGRLKCKYSRTK
jgi:hypothetical protein